MNLNLTEKVAIVTGASRGIGRAIAQTLAAEGMKLTLAARSKDQLDELASSLKTDCLVHAVDLSTPGAAPAVVEATIKKFGAIDLLVNNAGATKRGDFFELTDEDWDDGFALKLAWRKWRDRGVSEYVVRSGLLELYSWIDQTARGTPKRSAETDGGRRYLCRGAASWAA